MKVGVELRETSQPIVRSDALNTYQKGDLFVVLREGGIVEKYPMVRVFRITEDYSHEDQ